MSYRSLHLESLTAQYYDRDSDKIPYTGAGPNSITQFQKSLKVCTIVRKNGETGKKVFLTNMTISRYFQSIYFPKQSRNHACSFTEQF